MILQFKIEYKVSTILEIYLFNLKNLIMHSVDVQAKNAKICKTLVILGHSETGKTNILQRYTKKRFENNYVETLGN